MEQAYVHCQLGLGASWMIVVRAQLWDVSWKSDRNQHPKPSSLLTERIAEAVPPDDPASLTSDNRGFDQRRKRSPSACFMTCPPTSEMDLVSGMSLGQTSTQFWA